jgi:lipopolysaccharide/colanic/teichoic acid biosynthesis glycosyltransferase
VKKHHLKPSPYHFSLEKKLLDLSVAALIFALSLPFFVLAALAIRFESKGPIFFKQRRGGRSGKVFSMYKFRTMKLGSQRLLARLRRLNEVNGPVFKIFDDPRYTKVGKLLAHTGLDELPQLINVFRGEMSLVGPRPLPLYEVRLLTKSQKIREQINPGITSSWIIKGAHTLKFRTWMQLDSKYVYEGSLEQDLSILTCTARLILKQGFRQIGVG